MFLVGALVLVIGVVLSVLLKEVPLRMVSGQQAAAAAAAAGGGAPDRRAGANGQRPTERVPTGTAAATAAATGGAPTCRVDCSAVRRAPAGALGFGLIGSGRSRPGTSEGVSMATSR